MKTIDGMLPPRYQDFTRFGRRPKENRWKCEACSSPLRCSAGHCFAKSQEHLKGKCTKDFAPKLKFDRCKEMISGTCAPYCTNSAARRDRVGPTIRLAGWRREWHAFPVVLDNQQDVGRFASEVWQERESRHRHSPGPAAQPSEKRTGSL